MLKIPGSWNNWYGIYSDDRNSLRLSMGGFSHFSDDGISRRHRVWVDISRRPSNAMTISMEPFYSFNKDDLQYVATEEFSDRGEDRFIFAQINQKTLGIVFRTNFSIIPDLSIQYYGQPFVSAGKYSLFKHITSSRANKYEDRFHSHGEQEINYNTDEEVYEIDEDHDDVIDYSFNDPDFNFQQFRSNLVIRWEYQPGSTIFLVWSQSRTDYISEGKFDFINDLESLFDVHPDNIFLIKFNYWFSL